MVYYYSLIELLIHDCSLENHHNTEPPILPPAYPVSLAAGGILAIIDALSTLRDTDSKVCIHC